MYNSCDRLTESTRYPNTPNRYTPHAVSGPCLLMFWLVERRAVGLLLLMAHTRSILYKLTLGGSPVVYVTWYDFWTS